MDCLIKYNETSLLNKESFYSFLNLQSISNSDYERARKVWNILHLNSFGDYHDVYIQNDT